MSTPYTYVFIRTDLPIPQQIVQAAHAAHNAGQRFGEHSHIVLFGVSSVDHLVDVQSRLLYNNVESELFYDSDINNGEYTALVTAPLRGDERRLMKRYKLYRTPHDSNISTAA